jgi:hypothetical protein
VKRTALVLFACVACSGRREATKLEPPPPSPVPAASTTVEPAADAGAGADGGAPFANVGRFSPRASLAVGERVVCMAMLQELAVAPNGQAWVVGACGIRFRIDESGKVDDFRAPAEDTRFLFAGQKGECKSTASFWGVYARSDHEVWVVGDKRCGMDPNTIWYRPLDTFDGKKWSATKVSFGKGAHDGLPWELKGNDQVLYTLVEGDDWHGPPECAVHPFVNGAWGKAELECPQPKGPDDRVMELRDLEVTADGTLWVAGQVLLHGKPTSGMLWKRAKGEKTWTEIAIDDLVPLDVSVGSDGSVFAAGKSLWRRTGETFVRVSEGTTGIASLWVESAERVWLIREGSPFVYVAGKEQPVEVDSPVDSFDRVRGSGQHVWAISRSGVWQLRTGDEKTTPFSVKIDTPTD